MKQALTLLAAVCLLLTAHGQVHRPNATRRTHGVDSAPLARGGVACGAPLAGTYAGTAASMTDVATAYTSPAACYQ